MPMQDFGDWVRNSIVESMGGSMTPSWAPGNRQAYGTIPQLPPTTTDTSSRIGTDVQGQMLRNLPNYQAMSAADSANITGNLAGQVSPDVIGLMQQQGAERGILTGTEGSQSNNAAYLRALGLTSMQLQQLGHTQLSEAMQRTPIQQTETTSQTTDLRPQQAVYNSAPDPYLAAQEQMRAMGAGMRGMGGISMPSYRGGGAAPSQFLPQPPILPQPDTTLPGQDYGAWRPWGYTGQGENLAPGLTYGMQPKQAGGDMGLQEFDFWNQSGQYAPPAADMSGAASFNPGMLGYFNTQPGPEIGTATGDPYTGPAQWDLWGNPSVPLYGSGEYAPYLPGGMVQMPSGGFDYTR